MLPSRGQGIFTEPNMPMQNENMYPTKQNRSTEGCSKLKRSVDMTSSGKNGLNIRTNANTRQIIRYRATATKSQMGKDQVYVGVSVLCWLAAPVAMFYGNLQNLVIRSKSVIKSSSVISSQLAKCRIN